ncbi:TPA: Ig-like domain-containing protein [Aeromonas hydrophila]
MKNLVAEVVNPTGHKVTLEARGRPTVTLLSAYEAVGPQHFPVQDEADFERLRAQIRKCLRNNPAVTVTLIERPAANPTTSVSMTAAPLSAIADGVAAVAVTVTVLANGEPAAGVAIELSADLGALTVTKGTTNEHGQFDAAITAEVAGSATVTAVAAGHGQTEVKVTFTAPTNADAEGVQAKKKAASRASKPKASETPNTQE